MPRVTALSVAVAVVTTFFAGAAFLAWTDRRRSVETFVSSVVAVVAAVASVVLVVAVVAPVLPVTVAIISPVLTAAVPTVAAVVSSVVAPVLMILVAPGSVVFLTFHAPIMLVAPPVAFFTPKAVVGDDVSSVAIAVDRHSQVLIGCCVVSISNGSMAGGSDY